MSTASGRNEEDLVFIKGLVRAFGGALIFSMPMLMTIEMWQLGVTASHARLALLLVLTIPLLVGLSHYMGFEATFGVKDDVCDAFAALAVGFTLPTVVLLILAVLKRDTPGAEIAGTISLQAVPASIGAMFARSELGAAQLRSEQKVRHAGFWGEIFIMAAGALFLGLNVAPTEEMVLIAYKSAPWHSIALVLVSLAVMHAFVYTAGFGGQHRPPAGTAFWSVFLRFTVVGYATALLMSAYILWTFGRLDDVAAGTTVSMLIALGFPSAVGAAAARLLL